MSNHRGSRHSLLSLLLVALAGAPVFARSAIPPPSKTPARVVVSGRTSTAADVRTVSLGQRIPPTFSSPDVTNTAGFTWHVSQHYALKTDYKSDKARHYLTLLELAYPHYVELFGGEPEGIDEKRVAVVYASSRKQLGKAMKSDDIHPAGDIGGGITMLRNRVAYCYPSGTLSYHQRYIVLHECTHAFQMCLHGTTYNTPGWYYEGVADSLASHVYDTKRRRLTLHVHDKPTTHDYLDEGLAGYRKTPFTAQQLNQKGGRGRGPGFLFASYLLTDPDRAQKFRIWRDEMSRLMPTGKAVQATSGRLLQELFGPWSRIDASFRQWVEARRNTFHYAQWGWEQEADTLWSYGFATDGKLSQTDVYLIPSERPAYGPLRMDYPMQPPSPLVGPVARGVPEPAVGALVDFSRHPARGRAGIGLGLVRDSKTPADCLRILVEASKSLALDGSRLGIEPKSVPIPDAFRDAMKLGGNRIGLTAKIAAKALEVTLRAGDPKANKTAVVRATLPLSDAQRRRLLSSPGTLLARDGWHGVTPYFDDRRRPEPDLSVPAPPNRWRNPGDKPLALLTRLAWRLGPDAPPSLTALRKQMLAAVTRGPEAQKQALAAFDAKAPSLLEDVRLCGAPSHAIDQAVAELIGISLRLELRTDPAPGHVQFTALLHGPLTGEAKGQLRFRVEPPGALAVVPAAEEVTLKQRQRLLTKRVYRLGDSPSPFEVRARAELLWRDKPVSLAASRTARPSIGAWWIIGPFANPGGDTKDIEHPVEKRLVDTTRRFKSKSGRTLRWRKVARDPSADLGAENVVDLLKAVRPYGAGENAAAYAFTWLDAPEATDAALALGSDDGVVVWFNGARVHTNLVARAYASKTDLVPIRLEKGRNQLLLKITQGAGEWAFCVHLEDRSGHPLLSVIPSLDGGDR